MEAHVLNKVTYEYANLEEAWPDIDPGVKPFGSRVLVQMRAPKTVTKGGIHLPETIQDTEVWNTQVAKVCALGDLAFKRRDTQTPWPEGAWAKPGDYVRVPKYGGDRWSVRNADGVEIIFVLFNDLDLLGAVTGDPLAMKAFI